MSLFIILHSCICLIMVRISKEDALSLLIKIMSILRLNQEKVGKFRISY